MTEYTKTLGKLLFNVKLSNELWEVTSSLGEKRKMLLDLSIITHANAEGTVYSLVLPFIAFQFRKL